MNSFYSNHESKFSLKLTSINPFILLLGEKLYIKRAVTKIIGRRK